MKVGLALSGGGSRGFAHLGAIQALREKGFRIDAISGASAGSIVGALIAAGHEPPFIRDAIIAEGVRKHLSFALNRFGLFSLKNVEKLLIKYIPHNTFEGLSIPLFVATTDLEQSSICYYSSGELAKPILASCSIPGIFEPLHFDNKVLVDGGIANNLPVEPLENVVDYIIGINVTPSMGDLPIKSAKEVLLKSLYMSISRQSSDKLSKCDLAIEPKALMRYDALSISKAHEMYDIGYESALSQIESQMPQIH